MADDIKCLSKTELEKEYQPWLVRTTNLNKYDVFVSYRSGNNEKGTDGKGPDDDLVAKIVDRLTDYTVGEDNRPITTFFDKRSLDW